MKRIFITGIIIFFVSHAFAQAPPPVTDGAKAAPARHYIGEFFGGGIVFYVYKDDKGIDHGLIVGLTDLSDAQVWSNVQRLIGSNAESTWNGKINTKAVIAQEGHTTSAAILCDTSTAGGQKDWYLPSMQELNMLWNNLYTINNALSSDSNAATVPIAETVYWSSTEDDETTFAWYFGMYDGGSEGSNTAGTTYKSELYHVRAIRSF